MTKNKTSKLDKECWNLDHTIAEFVLPRLKHFKKTTQSYPGDLTPKSWKKEIDKMIVAFELINEEDNFTTLKNWKIKNDKIDKGLNSFSKYFRSLWS